MATKIQRKLMKIFGKESGLNQRSVFGSLASGLGAFSTDPEVIQSNGNYLGGWFSSVLGGNSPAIEDMNSLHFLYAYQLAYLMQAGIAEWDVDTEYFTGSLVSSAGRVYESLIDNNLSNAVSDTASWAPKNPMSAAGDLIYGGAGGRETRLPIGAEGQLLTVSAGAPVWAQGVPPGTIFEYSGLVVPSGYLSLGQDVSRTVYANLFAAIGCAYGIGDGLTTFTLPPMGYFSRPVGDASDVDSALRGPNKAGTHSIAGATTTSGSSIVNISSTANLAPGMTIVGSGIPTGTVVRSITTSIFVMGNTANSANVNATTTDAQSLTFSKSATGNYLGSVQDSQFSSHNHIQDAHNHYYLSNTAGYPIAGTGGSYNLQAQALQTSDAQPYIHPEGGSETRPVNISFNKIMKF